MPDYVLKALFVATGLSLIWLCLSLGRHVGARAGRFGLGSVAGLAGLFTANAVAGLFGFGVGVNWFSCAAAALLGLPGVGLLYALRYLVFRL